MDSPEAVRSIQWMNRLYRDEGRCEFTVFEDFSNFKIGMTIGPYSNFLNFSNNMKMGDRIGVAPLPYFEGGKPTNNAFMEGYGISKKSKHSQEAWEFIKYLALTNQEVTSKLIDSYLSTSKAIAEATGQSTDPNKSVAIAELDHVENHQVHSVHSFLVSYTTNWLSNSKACLKPMTKISKLNFTELLCSWIRRSLNQFGKEQREFDRLIWQKYKKKSYYFS